MAEVLMRAKWAGFIRWHILTALDGSCFSSTYRNNCQTSFDVMVKFEERDAAVNPLVLDRKHLSALVRRFGADLEQLRKLTRLQMFLVAIGLESAGFVDGFLVAEAIQDGFESSENCSIDAIQPAPYLLPQPPASPYLTLNAPSLFAGSPSWEDYPNAPENIDIGLADWSFSTTDTPSESVSSVTEPILASDPNSCVEMTSPVTAYTPGDGAPFRSAPLDSYPSPAESELLGPETHTMIAPHVPIFLPNVDEGASHYSTPLSYGNEVSDVEEQSIRPESGRLMASQTENMDELFAGDLSVPMAHGRNPRRS
ncbi:hypothetical protein N7445_008881 [Penicillium cf. griseofulvum]|nr:hypothetical protein N7445_008881 [Penicillium cf. griseofulvum]